jgi:hypothetical protein
MTIAIEGIRVPDSTLAREIAEFVRGCGNAIAFLSFPAASSTGVRSLARDVA